ncbi:MAG TPA: Hsp20/alpha crystallin family protein [Myxococcales bacterium]|jgi:HSP20 family protein
MAITRWEPFREMARMQDELNRLFDDRVWRRRGQGQGQGQEEELGAGFLPPVDVYEDQEALVLTTELPGVDPKDVDVRVEDGVLTLKGERKLEKEDKKENYLRVERSYGSFTRSFTLPTTVDPEKVKAEFKNGLLRLAIPKREESKPRSIKVDVQ